ncbi:hypothetical protein SAMN00017477_1563 [Peptoniphilus asaccharolyticus DSM 20463]|uniref:Uncharacterized protein n=1 Tax=Peptoniphilus asaccharolyticus DSM 20463 TaxID=573058 RepID=A0A1W1VA40_PEPAS|nr:hypothetical protein SAMN00017477_1563 [Peptoniphilus asaccharolyticus DSM 20463]
MRYKSNANVFVEKLGSLDDLKELEKKLKKKA